MLCSLISPESELIPKAEHSQDWEMVAPEVQTKLWQLSKDTDIMPSPELGSFCGASLGLSNDFTLSYLVLTHCMCDLSDKETKAQRS